MITDRTQADIDKALTYRKLVIANPTGPLPSDFNRVMNRGCCDSTMLKRINSQLGSIQYLLKRYGYYTSFVFPDEDLDNANTIFSRELYEQVFKNVKNAKDNFWVYSTTPEIPTYLYGWREANDIEKVLEDIGKTINDMVDCMRECNEVICGEGDTL